MPQTRLHYSLVWELWYQTTSQLSAAINVMVLWEPTQQILIRDSSAPTTKTESALFSILSNLTPASMRRGQSARFLEFTMGMAAQLVRNSSETIYTSLSFVRISSHGILLQRSRKVSRKLSSNFWSNARRSMKKQANSPWSRGRAPAPSLCW